MQITWTYASHYYPVVWLSQTNGSSFLPLKNNIWSLINFFEKLKYYTNGMFNVTFVRWNRNWEFRKLEISSPGWAVSKWKSLSYPILCNSFICPWNSPGKNIGVGYHSLLQGIFPTQGSNPGLLLCRQILYHLSLCPLWESIQQSPNKDLPTGAPRWDSAELHLNPFPWLSSAVCFLKKERRQGPWCEDSGGTGCVSAGTWIARSSIQSLSHVQLFVTPWIRARQASLSSTNSWSLFKLMPIESVW